MTNEEKAYLRQVYKAKRERIPESIRNAYSKQVLSNLLESESYISCDIVLCYASIQSEVITYPMLDYFLSNKKAVCCPKIKDNAMDFYQINSINDLKEGYFRIPEPIETIPVKFCQSSKVLILTPGLAFDERGYRIGYGKGFYDRYFMTHKEIPMNRIGITFSSLITTEFIPNDEYDIPVDYLCSDTEFRATRKGVL